MRRRFSKKERQALFLVADGRSELSGELLGDDWEADHIIPWSKGGVTDLSNAQAITLQENRRKGNVLVKLRDWQQEFINEFNKSDRTDFMLAALPGGGKTVAALSVAQQFLNNHPEGRIIVVVPTLNLCEQWRGVSYEHFRISLRDKEFTGSMKGFQGAVVTYQTVASQNLVFKKITYQYPCLIILDEIHHAGDQSSWGLSIKEAFQGAIRRLSMSGTPFKSDGQLIPFLSVESNGEYRIDFRYDWPRAQRDKVIRELVFPRWKGEVQAIFRNQAVTFHTDDELNDEESRARLKGLVTGENFAKGMLRKANEQLEHLRRYKPDAGALAICVDTDHALVISRLLREITGEEPALVLSDESYANTGIREFRESNRKWIVAIRMVSEGVDIKRLMVLAYLTNYKTNLFFRQAVGRIMRYENTDFDTEAYCFLPEDPDLISHAARIEEFIAEATKAEDEQQDHGDGNDREYSERVPIFTVLGSSDAEFAGLTTAGTSYDASYSQEIKNLSDRHGIAQSKMAAILGDIGYQSVNQRQASSAAVQSEAVVDTMGQMDQLRNEMKRLVGIVRRKTGELPGDVHRRYFKVCSTPTKHMSLDQLKAKREWLIRQINPI